MKNVIALLVLALSLSACLSGRPPGGYFEDDGPHREIPVDVSKVADAVPKWEAVDPSRSRPYIVLGHKYYPMTDARDYRERGVASWYGKKFHGRRTALGEKYDMYSMTAAHKTLPLPGYAQVRNLANGKTVVVRINDRGPFLHKRLIDLSYAAAYKLDMLKTGTANVEVVAITPGTRPPASTVVKTEPIEDPAPTAIMAEPLAPVARESGTPAPAIVVDADRAGASGAVATVGTTPVGGSNKVYVQVGAFATAANAEKLRVRLEQAEFNPVRVRPVQRENRALYRVQIGPLANTQTEAVNRRLVDLGLRNTRVINEASATP